MLRTLATRFEPEGACMRCTKIGQCSVETHTAKFAKKRSKHLSRPVYASLSIKCVRTVALKLAVPKFNTHANCVPETVAAATSLVSTSCGSPLPPNSWRQLLIQHPSRLSLCIHPKGCTSNNDNPVKNKRNCVNKHPARKRTEWILENDNPI